MLLKLANIYFKVSVSVLFYGLIEHVIMVAYTDIKTLNLKSFGCESE